MVPGVLVAALAGCARVSLPSGGAAALPHFFRVDHAVWRGGQPTPEGFRQLAALGVKTVVDLRSEGARETERDLVESLGMRWVHLPMRIYWRPSETQITAFLQVIDDPVNRPVFIHCRQGEDRTGALIALYRVARQGWRPQDAYAEARSLGLAGWNVFVRHLVFRDADARYGRSLAAVLDLEQL